MQDTAADLFSAYHADLINSKIYLTQMCARRGVAGLNSPDPLTQKIVTNA